MPGANGEIVSLVGKPVSLVKHSLKMDFTYWERRRPACQRLSCGESKLDFIQQAGETPAIPVKECH